MHGLRSLDHRILGHRILIFARGHKNPNFRNPKDRSLGTKKPNSRSQDVHPSRHTIVPIFALFAAHQHQFSGPKIAVWKLGGLQKNEKNEKNQTQFPKGLGPSKPPSPLVTDDTFAAKSIVYGPIERARGLSSGQRTAVWSPLKVPFSRYISLIWWVLVRMVWIFEPKPVNFRVKIIAK